MARRSVLQARDASASQRQRSATGAERVGNTRTHLARLIFGRLPGPTAAGVGRACVACAARMLAPTPWPATARLLGTHGQRGSGPQVQTRTHARTVDQSPRGGDGVGVGECTQLGRAGAQAGAAESSWIARSPRRPLMLFAFQLTTSASVLSSMMPFVSLVRSFPWQVPAPSEAHTPPHDPRHARKFVLRQLLR